MSTDWALEDKPPAFGIAKQGDPASEGEERIPVMEDGPVPEPPGKEDSQ